MVNKKSVAGISLLIILVISLLLTFVSKGINTIFNNIGVSVTIVGFFVTLYLLKEVVDLSTVNNELEERRIFKERILPNLQQALEDLTEYTKLCLENPSEDSYAERNKIYNSIRSVYTSDYIKQMRKVAHISPGFTSFERQFNEFYALLKKSVFIKNGTPPKIVIETVDGISQAFLFDVKTYIDVLNEKRGER